jgi:hypothetical protein
MDIKRYSLPNETSYGDEIPDDWLKMENNSEGDYVKYKDHLAIVEKLKAELEELSIERLYESYNEIFHKGYQDGWNDAKQFLRFD